MAASTLILDSINHPSGVLIHNSTIPKFSFHSSFPFLFSIPKYVLFLLLVPYFQFGLYVVLLTLCLLKFRT